MATRSKKKTRRESTPSDEPMMDINTTPLIDVMLVLLIMLIITIPIQLHSVNLNMPVTSQAKNDAKPEVLRIDIDAHSVIQWNGESILDRTELERRIEQVAAQAVQPEVHLRPDKRAKYDVVAGVMVSVQRLGLTKLGIVGSEQFIP